MTTKANNADSSETSAGPEPAAGPAARPSLIRRALPEGQVASSIAAGLIVGTLALIKDVSLATLVFSGPLSKFVSAGIGLMLIGATVVAILVALLSSLKTAMATPQDTGIAVLAVVAGTIAAESQGSVETRFVTVVAACAMTTVLAGACFLLLGLLRLGKLVRFIPHPVVGGFMAGAGWLIVKGAVGVMVDTPLTWHGAALLFRNDALTRWAPGLGLAVVLLILVRKLRHYLVMPLVIVAGIIAFYVAVWQLGGISVARQGGWLLGPFPEGGLLQNTMADVIAGADWPVVINQAGQISAIIVVSVLALLLNASSLELALGKDIDLNRELVAAGVANIFAGAAGGMPGYPSLSMSTLTWETGGRARIAGVAAGMVAMVALIGGSSFLTYLPRPVVGGMLLYMGLDFLYTWIVKSARKLPRAEYGVVVLILVATGGFGFLFAVGVGIVATVVLFVLSYGGVRVVRQELTISTRRSNVQRSPHDQEILRAHGDETMILHLQGYLFFGTASQVLDSVRKRVADGSQPRLRHFILDFRLVTGIDSSAAMGFDRLRQLCETRDLNVVLVHLSDDMFERFVRVGLLPDPGTGAGGDPRVHTFMDLNAGIQWVEEQLLEPISATHDEEDGKALWAELERIFGSAAGRYFRRRKFEPGDYLMKQGDESNDMLFILSGQVSVILTLEDGSTVHLRTMRPGTVVGELGWFKSAPRSASVVAETPTTVCRLTRRDLTTIDGVGPKRVADFYEFMFGLVADRLADTSETLRTYLDG